MVSHTYTQNNTHFCIKSVNCLTYLQTISWSGVTTPQRRPSGPSGQHSPVRSRHHSGTPLSGSMITGVSSRGSWGEAGQLKLVHVIAFSVLVEVCSFRLTNLKEYSRVYELLHNIQYDNLACM